MGRHVNKQNEIIKLHHIATYRARNGLFKVGLQSLDPNTKCIKARLCSFITDQSSNFEFEKKLGM